MAMITEAEFASLCKGIAADRETIIKHNPIGRDDEILLWMLLSCLISFLSLTEIETPCFKGKPDAATYREAIDFVLRDRREDNFNTSRHLGILLGNYDN